MNSEGTLLGIGWSNRSIDRRADNSPLKGQGLHEALENVGALDRALRRICGIAGHIAPILNTPLPVYSDHEVISEIEVSRECCRAAKSFMFKSAATHVLLFER